MPERRFTKKETAKILRRAAELQGHAPSGSESAVSESELFQAAREVGIEPASLEAAIGEVLQPRSNSAGVWGGPLKSEHEAVYDGVLTEDLWEDTVADLRRSFGEEGKISVRGALREWTSGGELYRLQFTVREMDGQLRVSTSVSGFGLAVLLYMLSMMPIMIGCSIIGKKAHLSPLFTGVAMFAVIFGTYVLSRFAITRSARSLHRSMAETASRFRKRTEGAVGMSLQDSRASTAEGDQPLQMPELS